MMPAEGLSLDSSTAIAFAPPAPHRVQILHGQFDALSTSETVDWAMRLIQSGQRGYLCTVNVAILMMMQSNDRLRQFVEKAALIVADGQPLIWVSHWFSCPLPERVTGIDLIDELCARAAQENVGIYLLGATSEVITTAATNLQARYPELHICGFDDGYFKLDQAEARVKAVRESGAQILFVAMGVPRQEQFLEENWSELGVNLAIGVGGSFDVIAGIRHRAPFWVQEVGLEWLYRLLQEPGRLWKRYLVTNSQFVYQVIRALVQGALPI
ncbi:MAG: WecB/TagA/CpsF family glycosyltransferase [Elainella sp. Prado103]|jgi:N-acetylglucosaminyldiphosphoundecaprenol N-acetyl-beta-D-mannosaminyltransferase|nr:WecB/TagA/CpsF family glycosyltransferase [Elainella sp. Prado103]